MDNEFLDDSLIIKKEQNITNTQAEMDIHDWPQMTDEIKESLQISEKVDNKETENIDNNETTNSKKNIQKKKQIKKNNKIERLKTKQDVLNELYEKSLYQYVEKDVNIHVYQKMMKAEGTNETRNRYTRMIDNNLHDIAELREKIEIIKDMIKQNGKSDT